MPAGRAEPPRRRGTDPQLRQWPAIRSQHLDPTRFDDIGRISGFSKEIDLGTGGNLFAWQAFIHCLCPKTGRDDDNDITRSVMLAMPDVPFSQRFLPPSIPSSAILRSDGVTADTQRLRRFNSAPAGMRQSPAKSGCARRSASARHEHRQFPPEQAVDLAFQRAFPIRSQRHRRDSRSSPGRSPTSTCCPGAITVSQWQRFSSCRTLPWKSSPRTDTSARLPTDALFRHPTRARSSAGSGGSAAECPRAARARPAGGCG